MTKNPAEPSTRRISVADVPGMAARYDRRNVLPPEAVPAHSNKKYFWTCEAAVDHRWQATAKSIASSSRGGCPFCAGKRPSTSNRLDVLFPAVAAEWDAELNQGPPAVIAGSEKKAWWRCGNGHSWLANIRNRTVLGAGCPHCSAASTSRRMSLPVPGRSLADLYPVVAGQWHPVKNPSTSPAQVAPQSNAAVWWLCDSGHEWRISPAGRIAKGGAGCPFCSGRFATPETSLQVQNPGIAAEWHPTRNGKLTPLEVKPATGKLAWWICPSGHEYKSKIANRTALGRRCPYCSGQKIGYGNDLASRAPHIAAEWHPSLNGTLRPGDVTTGVQRRFWWLCQQGHSWRTTVASRVALGTGCPECGAGWRRSRPEITLQCELEALLPAAVDGDVVVNTLDGPYRVDVVCSELRIAVEYDGGYWHGATEERDRQKSDALIHGGWLLIRVRQEPLPPIGPHDVGCEPGTPDPFHLALRVIDRIAEAAVSLPVDHPCRSRQEELRTSAADYRLRGELRALERANQLVAAGRQTLPMSVTLPPPPPRPGHSLAEKNPAIAKEWHPSLNGEFRPENIANARNASAWWMCSGCGDEWQAKINERVRRGNTGCPRCNRAKAGKRRSRPALGQSLAERFPEVAAEWHPTRNGDLAPTHVRAGSHTRVWWKCRLGHEWENHVYNRTGRTPGCPHCARVVSKAKRVSRT